MRNSPETATYRQVLLALRARLTEDHSQLKENVFPTPGGEMSGVSSELPRHQVDAAGHGDDREINLTLLRNEEHLLAEVDAALGRLEQGTFGRCETCGQAIPAGRLKVVPYTRFCVRCARQMETAEQ
jgi:RNA polymerase-binding transcription factor DksA